MVTNDCIIVQKPNAGKIKKMNIYGAVNLLTKEEIGRLVKGKKVRKGHYLYYIERYEVEEVKEEEVVEAVVESDEDSDFIKEAREDMIRITEMTKEDEEN